MEPLSNPMSATPSTSSSAGTVDRAAQAAHQTIDRVAAKAGPALDKLRTVATSASDSLHAKAADMGHMPEQWAQSSRTYIREHPLTAVGMGLVVGILLGKLSR
jgi:ElaB/YqjD/DUF883 family membrane-anchored ribosome-binding protein